MTRDDHHRRAVVLSLGCPQGAHFLFFSFILKPENSVPKKYCLPLSLRDPCRSFALTLEANETRWNRNTVEKGLNIVPLGRKAQSEEELLKKTKQRMSLEVCDFIKSS